jgi:hypothetical protein
MIAKAANEIRIYASGFALALSKKKEQTVLIVKTENTKCARSWRLGEFCHVLANKMARQIMKLKTQYTTSFNKFQFPNR